MFTTNARIFLKNFFLGRNGYIPTVSPLRCALTRRHYPMKDLRAQFLAARKCHEHGPGSDRRRLVRRRINVFESRLLSLTSNQRKSRADVRAKATVSPFLPQSVTGLSQSDGLAAITTASARPIAIQAERVKSNLSVLDQEKAI